MKVNFRRILYYLWPHIKKHWVALFGIFFAYACGVILNDILQPLVIKQIIDVLSSGLNKDLILNQTTQLILVICVLIVSYNVGYRTGDFMMAYFQSKVMKRLYDFTFNRLLQHSYHFFSNNFSGSIIAKSKRFTKSYETFTDIV
ncbi:MAG TPA: hypothetical protein VGO21_04795, partial [Candidatus Paceibacterota bacterium]|nr:hypothetical protein [Candidatus Paceibacterota bacterium]